MARALGILHTPVEVAALGYDWVAGSLQADVALEELYGLYLFVAGLTTRHVEDGSHGRSLSSQPTEPLKSTDSFPGPHHTTAFIHRWQRLRVARMSSTQSKAEYLKRYLDGGGTDASEQKRDKKEHKHKKHKRHHHHHHSGMRVIDADEVVAAGGREIYDEDEEEKPQLDEAAAALVAAHTAQRATSAAAPRSAPVSQWEEVPIGKSKRTLHDSPDPSPPRRRPERHDSPAPQPASPPARAA